MPLRQLQTAVQNAIIHNDVGPLHASHVLVLDTASAIGVYQQAYRTRLRDTLHSHYPMLAKHLGFAAFNQLADVYIGRHTPETTSLRDYGDRLAAACLSDLPSDQAETVAELASFEWKLAHAFDALEGSPVTVSQLSTIEPSRWADLRFTGVPSLLRHRATTPAVTLWRQLHQTDTDSHATIGALSAVGQASEHSPTDWVISRIGLEVRFRSIPPDESAALDILLSGLSFAHLCEHLADTHHEATASTAATWLKTWVEAGWLETV